MKKQLITIFVVALTMQAFAWQGVIKQKYFSTGNKGTNVTVSWYLTNTECKMQMDFDGENIKSSTYFIPDFAGNRLLTYTEGGITNLKHVDSTKNYFAIPLEIIQQNAQTGVTRLSVVKTGETKSIQGFICERVLVKTNLDETEMWVTKDFAPEFYKFYTFFRSSTELMALNDEKMSGFPIQSVTKDFSGKVVSSYELLSVQAKEFKTTDFNVPAGYTLVK